VTYHAVKCPCGAAVCRNWLVDPVANVQGVAFTEVQARFVTNVLNLAEVNGEEVLTTRWLLTALKAMRERNTTWRPVATVPAKRDVLVRGRSETVDRDRFVCLAVYDPVDWHEEPWRDVYGGSLAQLGWTPEEWTEVPA